MTDPWENARLARAIVATHYPEVAEFHVSAFLFLGLTCRNHAAAPPMTPQAAGRRRYEIGRLPRERFPRWQVIWPPPLAAAKTLPDVTARWLRNRLAGTAERRLMVNYLPSSTRGPLPQRWALTLRDVAPWLAAVLVQNELPVSTRKTSAFTKTCRDLLQSIHPDQKLPSLSTISRVLGNILQFSKHSPAQPPPRRTK